jgi:protein-disulfide isomerase
VAALLCLKNIPFATDPGTPMWRTGSGKRGVPPQALFSLVLVGVAGVVVLAGGQVLVQPQRNVVKEVKNTTTAAGTNQVSPAQALPAEIVPSSPHLQMTGRRTLSLYNQEFVIKLDEVPVLGSPDAPNVIVCLLDYTCSHCRALHPILLQMSQAFSNQLAIVCLPVTLSPRCNPYIPATSKANPESCEYAQMALAVWRTRPEVFHQYDDWLFADTRVPSVDEARAYAEKLVGADKLRAALNDPWVDQQIQTDIKIHRANWLAVDDSAMPQIMMGDAVSSGEINSVEHLQLLLGKYLGVHLTAKGM